MVIKNEPQFYVKTNGNGNHSSLEWEVGFAFGFDGDEAVQMLLPLFQHCQESTGQKAVLSQGLRHCRDSTWFDGSIVWMPNLIKI